MTCDEAVDALAALEPGEGSPANVLEHLEACPDCRRKAGDFADLDALARRALPGTPAPGRLPLFRWAAALLVAAAGLAVLWRKAEPPDAIPVPPPQSGTFLEVAPGGDASLAGTTLVLRSGACWLDTKVAVEMTEPERVRFEAGSEAEIRIEPPSGKAAWSLLGEARAGTPPEVLVSVVSGSARAGDARIPAGSRARLVPGKRAVLEPLDAASIDAWRAELRSERTFSTSVRNVTGNLVLGYPAGETTLGDLPAWRDGAWHRIAATWRGSGTEVFLDGRRILRIPVSDGSGTPGISVRDGTMERRP